MGSPELITEKVGRLTEAGEDHCCALKFPVDDVQEMLNQMQWFAEAVMPHFRERQDRPERWKVDHEFGLAVFTPSRPPLSPREPPVFRRGGTLQSTAANIAFIARQPQTGSRGRLSDKACKGMLTLQRIPLPTVVAQRVDVQRRAAGSGR